MGCVLIRFYISEPNHSTRRLIAQVGPCQTVCRALAHRLTKIRILLDRKDGQDPADAMYERLCWAMGVDGTRGWEPALPSADAMRPGVEQWVKGVTSKRGVWGSQRAAITALVLNNASPQEARQTARAAFEAGRV